MEYNHPLSHSSFPINILETKMLNNNSDRKHKHNSNDDNSARIKKPLSSAFRTKSLGTAV